MLLHEASEIASARISVRARKRVDEAHDQQRTRSEPLLCIQQLHVISHEFGAHLRIGEVVDSHAALAIGRVVVVSRVYEKMAGDEPAKVLNEDQLGLALRQQIRKLRA